MNTIGTYFIITYGCQMNIHESEKIAGILSQMGYTLAQDENVADVVVFNTCCIRENAECKAEGNIGALKRCKKLNPNKIIAVGGCMTQQKGFAEKLCEKFPFIDIVFGTHNLENFRKLLENKLESKKRVVEILDKECEITEGTPRERTSFPNAWINIMYGCNNFCSYCIVPYVRGRERSRQPSEIIKECLELISQGYKEITLLGQNVNSYGKDLDGVTFAQLISQISSLDGDFRLKFMTNHPKDLSRELILELSKSNKTDKTLHLPLQSGSNRILKLMNRKYTREEYLEKVKMLRNAIPEISITTDIMVGFPTETEQDFLDTLEMVKTVEFAGAFTFIYSKRSGTPAAVMEGQIDEEVAKDRIMRLIDVQNAINRKQSKNYLNKTIKILCEGFDEKKNMYLGRDDYGRMAYFKANTDYIGKFVKVKITNTGGISLIGELI